MYIITVDFQIDPHHLTNFKIAMETQARQSILDEIDCHQFDVCYDQNQSNHCFLYEVYSSEAAFESHLKTSHFRDFDEQVRTMLLSKTVQIYKRSFPSE